MKELRIAMIDDDVEFATMVQRFLTHAGYQVTVNHHWLQMMRTIRRDRPDLVLVDVDTPTGNGISAIEFLSQQESDFPKIAFVTGQTGKEVQERCRRIGGAYIAKSGDCIKRILELAEDQQSRLQAQRTVSTG
jgi:CheY-like chemotaxis protein